MFLIDFLETFRTQRVVLAMLAIPANCCAFLLDEFLLWSIASFALPPAIQRNDWHVIALIWVKFVVFLSGAEAVGAQVQITTAPALERQIPILRLTSFALPDGITIQRPSKVFLSRVRRVHIRHTSAREAVQAQIRIGTRAALGSQRCIPSSAPVASPNTFGRGDKGKVMWRVFSVVFSRVLVAFEAEREAMA